MNIDEVHKYIDFIIKKTNAGGYISPTEKDMVLNRAQIQYFNKLYGNQNDYRYDRPVPKISYAVTEKISNSLSVFISDPVVLTVNSSGRASIPFDLFQTVAITKTINGIENEITRVEQDRVANNLTSYYDAPDTNFPIYTQLKTEFQFYPKNLASANLVYLRQPQNMVWGYNIGIGGRPVYNPSASVQPQWKDMDMNEIIYLALSYIGVNLKDPEVAQFANIKTQTGL